jgi:hypothetical protein
MSQWLNLACHEFGQDSTMQAVVGETVKPGQFLEGQIRDILVRIWCAGRSRPVADGGIWLRNRGFPALPNGTGRGLPIKVWFTTPHGTGSPAQVVSRDLPSQAAADVPCNSLMSLSLLVHLPNYNRPKAVLQ